jgi:energy-coupling factor transport system substrate-specific component
VEAFLRLVDQGKFRLPGDTGGGTMENIDNIHQQQAQCVVAQTSDTSDKT